MVGSLNWLITLGRYDVHHAASTLARYMMTPREGHLKAMKRVYCYLKYHQKFSIEYNVEEPDVSGYNVEQYDWFPMYEDGQEEMPYKMPKPKGKAVVLTGFFDASHACCLQTRRSMSSVLLFINKTPIYWFAKRQNTVESSTFGSECVSGRIAVDLSVELCYKLRMLGVPVKGSTLLFGDNESMVNQVTKPHSTLKKRHLANCYHRVREAVANKIVSIVHCASEWNLADMGTKTLPPHVHQRLLHNQVLPPFQCSRECWKKQQNIDVVGMVSPGKSQDVSQDLDMRKDTLIPGNNIVDLPASIEVPLSNGMEASVPLFTLKCGNVSLPIMCDKADCHVDDLILAFQDESFVRNVIKYGDI